MPPKFGKCGKWEWWVFLALPHRKSWSFDITSLSFRKPLKLAWVSSRKKTLSDLDHDQKYRRNGWYIGDVPNIIWFVNSGEKNPKWQWKTTTRHPGHGFRRALLNPHIDSVGKKCRCFLLWNASCFPKLEETIWFLGRFLTGPQRFTCQMVTSMLQSSSQACAASWPCGGPSQDGSLNHMLLFFLQRTMAQRTSPIGLDVPYLSWTVRWYGITPFMALSMEQTMEVLSYSSAHQRQKCGCFLRTWKFDPRNWSPWDRMSSALSKKQRKSVGIVIPGRSEYPAGGGVGSPEPPNI